MLLKRRRLASNWGVDNKLGALQGMYSKWQQGASSVGLIDHIAANAAAMPGKQQVHCQARLPVAAGHTRLHALKPQPCGMCGFITSRSGACSIHSHC